MFELAVDDRSNVDSGISLDILPNVQNGAAGGIDDHASFLRKQVQIGRRNTESRHNDDIPGYNSVILLGPAAWQKPDAHALEPGVDMRIVDDLAGEKDPPVR